MTSPLPAGEIIQLPGVGDRIGAAIAPFLEALRERREREQRQQQIMAQIGQLKLQQDEHAEKLKAANEIKRALAEQVTGAAEALKGLENTPGETTTRLSALAKIGDPKVFFEGTEQMGRELGTKQRKQIEDAFTRMAEERGSPLTPSEKAMMFYRFAKVDPANAGAWTNAANTQEQLSRPRGTNVTTRIRGSDVLTHAQNNPEMLPEGMTIDPSKMYNVRVDTAGKPLTVMGESTQTFSERLAEVGDVDQRNSAEFGGLLNNGLARLLPATRTKEMRNELAKALTVIEGARTGPKTFNINEMAEYVANQAQMGLISPTAQIGLLGMFEIASARAKKFGGLVLPPFEWARATRAVFPTLNESDEAWKSRLDIIDRDRQMSLRRGKGATERIKDLLLPLPDGFGGTTPSVTPSLDADINEAARIRP